MSHVVCWVAYGSLGDVRPLVRLPRCDRTCVRAARMESAIAGRRDVGGTLYIKVVQGSSLIPPEHANTVGTPHCAQYVRCGWAAVLMACYTILQMVGGGHTSSCGRRGRRNTHASAWPETTKVMPGERCGSQIHCTCGLVANMRMNWCRSSRFTCSPRLMCCR